MGWRYVQTHQIECETTCICQHGEYGTSDTPGGEGGGGKEEEEEEDGGGRGGGGRGEGEGNGEGKGSGGERGSGGAGGGGMREERERRTPPLYLLWGNSLLQGLGFSGSAVLVRPTHVQRVVATETTIPAWIQSAVCIE